MRILCFGGAAIGFLRSDRFLIPRLWVARSRLDIGRRSNPIPFGPSQSLGQSKTAATRPAPFCGRAATSPILAGETLRVVNLRNADRRDRDRKDGSAKDNRDDESGHFPSDGVQPIFRSKSLQISADPRWSTESVTWSGPLSTAWMITNRAQSTSFEEELRQRNSARRDLVFSNSKRLDLKTSRNFVREFNG